MVIQCGNKIHAIRKIDKLTRFGVPKVGPDIDNIKEHFKCSFCATNQYVWGFQLA